MFGAIAFIPLFVQGVLGGTATEAGQALTPLFLGWVVMSIVGARVTVQLGYRVVSIAGSVLMTTGFLGLVLLDARIATVVAARRVLVIGAGMGTQMLSLLLAVQHGVDRSRLGIATSLNQFSRSIGAAVGVAVMGAILARSLAGVTLPGGADGLRRVGRDGPDGSGAGAVCRGAAPRVPLRRGGVGRRTDRRRSSCRRSASRGRRMRAPASRCSRPR